MNFLDLFAGVGGFRFGMERAGHHCIGYVEWDKFARKSYEAIHRVTEEWTRHDITKITNEEWKELDGKVDIICGGFPCQSFSIAGKRHGFQDTRGTMFFEIARAAQQIKPRFLFLENVKGLLSHDRGNTFRTILTTLNELGYDAEWWVCNNKWFGIPQNRERTFIIASSREYSRSQIFSVERKDRAASENNLKRINNSDKTKELLGFDTTNRFYDISGISPTLTTHEEPKIMVVGNVNPSNCGMSGKVYYSDGLSPTLTAGSSEGPKVLLSKSGLEKLNRSTQLKTVLSDNGERSLFIQGATKRDNRNEKTEDIRIRKLTPRECWRLQSFPDWAYEKAAEVVSASQLYKQAGNSVAQEVVYQIALLAFN